MKNKNKKGYGRNYWALALEGASFVGGISIMSVGGFVALFINDMTGSEVLVGLAITMQQLLMLVGTLVMAPYVHSIRNLPKFMFKRMALQRVLPLFMALPLFFMLEPMTAVIIFLILYALFWLLDGILTMTWGELSARALSPEMRGHMMGMQLAVGGAVSLITGLFLVWLFVTPAETANFRFSVAFVLTAVLLLTSLIFIRMVKDPKPINNPKKASPRIYYSKIPALIKSNKPLQHALLARIPGYIGFSAMAFILVFGVNTLDVSVAQEAWLIYAKIVGGLISGILLGWVSRRLGNKTVIIVCNLGVIITLGLSILLAQYNSLGYIWLFALCMLAAIWHNNWLGYFNYFLDIAPPKDRPAFQLIGSGIGVPFSFFGFVLGAVIERWGYTAAFLTGIVAAFIAIIFSLRLLSRQRIKKLKHISQS